MENATRGPLFLEYLRFEPGAHLHATEVPMEPPEGGQQRTALEQYVDGLKVGPYARSERCTRPAPA